MPHSSSASWAAFNFGLSGWIAGDGSSLVDTLRYAPDAARLKSASLGALRRASAYADALVGAGRPLAAGPTG